MISACQPVPNDAVKLSYVLDEYLLHVLEASTGYEEMIEDGVANIKGVRDGKTVS